MPLSSFNYRTIFAALILVPLALAVSARAQDSMVPNRKLTPGKLARSDADRRGVSEAMERKVFDRYRLPWTRRAEFKVDHLIPLELGGADHIQNLWPQGLKIKPYGAHRKELLTRHLLTRIAAGQMTLAQAQEQISEDWIDCFIDQLGMVYLR